MNLIYLHFQGNKFTWYNHRQGSLAIFARLDRDLVNNLWLDWCCFITSAYFWFWHAPILLNSYTLIKNYNYKDFKFEAKCLLHDEFFIIVKDAWPLFVKGSLAYQLNRKIYYYKPLLQIGKLMVSVIRILIFKIYPKNWKIFQVELMINPSDMHLWSQDHDLRDKIHMGHMEQEIY